MHEFCGVVLDRDVVVIPMTSIDVVAFEYNGEQYDNITIDKAHDYFTAFYDWIHVHDQIRILRFQPFQHFDVLALAASRCPAVHQAGEMFDIDLPIAFSDARDLSQLFGYNAIFRAPSGSVIITIRIDDGGPRPIFGQLDQPTIV